MHLAIYIKRHTRGAFEVALKDILKVFDNFKNKQQKFIK